jgi:hypothetical protein
MFSASETDTIERQHMPATHNQAEIQALNASYTYCEKLKLSTVFDDFRNSETTSKDGAMVIVSMTFQCKVVPNPCNEPNVSCTEPQPLYPRK